MRIPAPLLLILPYVASVGCYSEPTSYAPYSVHSSGPTTGVALGETAMVSVSIIGTSRDDYGGCGTGPVLPTLSVDRVTCGPDCIVSAQHSTTFTVSSNSRGVKTVEIFTSTSDGKSSREAVSVEFREATKIEAVRDAKSPSGTRYAMFPGDTQEWSLGVADEKGPLFADLCKLQVEGVDVIQAAADCRAPGSRSAAGSSSIGAKVRATAFGAGTVTMSYGKLVRTERIQVIDPAMVRRAELVVPVSAGDGRTTPVEAETATSPLSDPLVLRYKCYDEPNPLLVVRLETNDGTVAFGGTTLLTTEPLGALAFTALQQSAQTKLVQVVDGTIRGDVGAAALAVPYVVRAGCSADDPPDSGVRDAGDAGDADDGADASDAGADGDADGGGL